MFSPLSSLFLLDSSAAGADKTPFNVCKARKYRDVEGGSFWTLTFPVVQLLLHDLNSLSAFQNVGPFCFAQICQELVPLLTALQELLQN